MIIGDNMGKNFKFNRTIGSIIQIVLILIVPGILMVTMGMLPNFELDNEREFILKGLLIPMILFYVSYIISIVLHELGHLIMGTKNRGTLIEYNFLLFSIYKESNKIKFKFKGLTSGLGGMCIMDFPQDLKEIEYKRFCLGGPSVNFLLSIIFVIVSVLARNNHHILLTALYMISMNFGFGISNLIPYETITGVETDGMKLYRMKTEKNYVTNLNKLFKIQRLLKKGVELKDIPDDLVYKPENINNKSDMEMMICYISKIIEEKKYEEAKTLIDECLSDSNKNKLSAMSKNNLKISLIDIYLRTDNIDGIKEIYDVELYQYVGMLCKFEKAVSVYLYLYYSINNIEFKKDDIRAELEKYFANNSDKPLVKDSRETYLLINKKVNKD